MLPLTTKDIQWHASAGDRGDIEQVMPILFTCFTRNVCEIHNTCAS